jgi:hypothetical protein
MHRIKEGLRRLILAKRLTATTDIQALIEKRHKDANLKMFNSSKNSVKHKPTRQTSPGGTGPSQSPRDTPHSSMTNEKTGSNSEDFVMGATTRQRAFVTASPNVNFSSVELRLYRRVKASRPNELVVISYGSIFLTPDCTAEGVRAAGSLVAMNPLGSRCGLETQMYTYLCHAMIKSLSANSFNRNS